MDDENSLLKEYVVFDENPCFLWSTWTSRVSLDQVIGESPLLFCSLVRLSSGKAGGFRDEITGRVDGIQTSEMRQSC